MTRSAPKLFLHAEGLAVLAAACFVYGKLGSSWGTFALLFLAPDLSMLGYIAGPKPGSWCYNLAHTYLGPALLACILCATGLHHLLFLAVVWTAHLGFDRLLGYGLKYPTHFKDTHLNRV